MKADRIGKLLIALDGKLEYVSRRLGGAPLRLPGIDQLRLQLESIRAMLRRYISKPDTVSEKDANTLDRELSILRDLASKAENDRLEGELSSLLKSLRYDYIGLGNLILGIRIGLGQLSPEEVFEATPGQKTAAYQFSYSNHIVEVASQPLRTKDFERDIALTALDGAAEDGVHVSEDLAGTNVSPRLRQAFAALQESLEAKENIIQIGQRVSVCSRRVQAEMDELSASLAGMLVAHVEMVSNAISQFEEWRIFCENAASVSVTQETVQSMINGARELARSLQNSQDVSPPVLNALETVANWAEGENVDTRDVLSLARTLENFCSAVAKSVLRLYQDVRDEVRKKAVTGVALVLLGSAALIAPALMKIPGAEWVQPALTYVKNLGGLSKP